MRSQPNPPPEVCPPKVKAGAEPGPPATKPVPGPNRGAEVAAPDAAGPPKPSAGAELGAAAAELALKEKAGALAAGAAAEPAPREKAGALAAGAAAELAPKEKVGAAAGADAAAVAPPSEARLGAAARLGALAAIEPNVKLAAGAVALLGALAAAAAVEPNVKVAAGAVAAAKLRALKLNAGAEAPAAALGALLDAVPAGSVKRERAWLHNAAAELTGRAAAAIQLRPSLNNFHACVRHSACCTGTDAAYKPGVQGMPTLLCCVRVGQQGFASPEVHAPKLKTGAEAGAAALPPAAPPSTVSP